MTAATPKMANENGDSMNELADWDPAIREAIMQTMANRVPAASRLLYASEWKAFQDWRAEVNPPFTGPSTSKQVHGYLAKRWKDGNWASGNTLWSKLSILRTMAHIMDKSQIKDDPDDLNIQAWLKSLGKTQSPKQAASFSRSEIRQYAIETSADPLTLPARLLMLIGCNVGCRSQTLYSLEFRHVKENEEGDLRVTVDFAQKHDQGAQGQTWLIKKNQEYPTICATQLFRQYHTLAVAAGLQNGWIWRKLHIVRGIVKMKNLRLGINWVYGLPRLIAEQLKLKEPQNYTGHSFRRSCAIWHANSGASDQEMRVHFGWKNASMASRYTSNSEIARQNAAVRTVLGVTSGQAEDSMTKIATPDVCQVQEISSELAEAIERPPMPIYNPAAIKSETMIPTSHPTKSSLFHFGGASIGVVNIYQGLPSSEQIELTAEDQSTRVKSSKERVKGQKEPAKRIRFLFKE